MQYTFYEIIWLYFIYSFLGGCAEVIFCALARKKFINRGFVTGPLCPIYGAGAVVFTIFLPELTESPLFLFLGSMILASYIEYFTGAILEKIFRKRWWNYSNHRFHLNGYICLKCTLVWALVVRCLPLYYTIRKINPTATFSLQAHCLVALTNICAVYSLSWYSAQCSGTTVNLPLIWVAESIFCTVSSGELPQ